MSAMTYIEITAGFIFLLGGAEVLVRGAVALARAFAVSPLVIGMTIVALGTSAPELIVALEAALSGAGALAIGNVVGSNIANILLILGFAALISPIIVKPRGFLGDAAILVGGTLFFIALCWSGMIGPGVIGPWSGGLLLIGFFAFLGYSYRREIGGGDPATASVIEEVKEMQGLPRSLWLAGLMIAGGLGSLLYGADILVDGATVAARAAGISEEVIGLTLVAFGTSLPELAASGVAAYRGHSDVALGNIFGSNLFNILGIAGLVAVVVPLPVPAQIADFDLWVMLGVTVLMVLFLRRGWRFGRVEAGLFLGLYGAYIAVQAFGVSALLSLAG